MRGSALAEFAVAWPVVLLLVVVAIQLAVYGVEVYAARASALIGARVGSEAGSDSAAAAGAAIGALRPSLVMADAASWCPGGSGDPPPGHPVWVCVTEAAAGVRVQVGGTVPAVVPLPVTGGLPLSADASLARETFQP